MKSLCQLLLIFLVATPVQDLRSEEKERNPFVELTPEEKAAEEAELVKQEPDHLVPEWAEPMDWKIRYTEQLGKRLDLGRSFFCRMVVMPSFSAEYAVALESESGKGGTLQDAGVLRLRYTTGDKSIWYSMAENNEEKIQKDVTVETRTVAFPAAMGVRVNKVWERMIEATRLPEMGGGGVDGVTFEFATSKGKGEVWTPRSRQSPLLFVELGKSLIDYCKAKEDDQKKAMKVIEEKLEVLEKYLDAKAAKEKKAE